jgi:hypothetical protein
VVFNDRLSYEFTYYTQNTLDALLSVQQPPSMGFTRTQLQNVGEIANNGIELGLNGTVLRKSFLTWELGANISTNHSKVLSTGAAVSSTLVMGYPAPVVRGTKVLNANDFADPVVELNSFFGANQPTTIIGGSTTLRLPHGLLLAARGEYQGGMWLSDFPSSLVVQRGPRGAVGCDDVYKLVPWATYDGEGALHNSKPVPANLGQVRAIDRARCFKNSRSDIWNMPGDFFKLREVTAQMQLPFNIPRIKSAFVTVSGRNLMRWTTKGFVSFDPEIISAREQITAFTFGISDQIPPPASWTVSIKANF